MAKYLLTVGFLGLVVTTVIGWRLWSDWVIPAREHAEHFNLREAVEFKQTTVVQDDMSQDLGRVFQENRINLSFDEVSPIFLQVLRFSEDRRFDQHGGVCWKGFLRALWKNLNAMSLKEGGSTITQQLAKNLLQDRSKTYLRKLREAFLAWRLEREFTKKEILELYLNRVYFGNGYHGVESAARGYFGHRASTLDWSESAILVTLLQSPSKLSPYKHPSLLRARAEQLLNQMRLAGVRVPDRADMPTILPRVQKVNGLKSYPVARAVGSWRDQELPDRIATTIRADWQQKLEDYASAQQRKFAAGVIHLPTGELKAYVGGRSYLDEPYDRFFSMRRNSGTLLAPFQLPEVTTFLEVYPGSESRVLTQDALSLNWRPALADNEPVNPAELLATLPMLGGYNVEGVRLVKSGDVLARSLLFSPVRDRLDVLTQAQLQSRWGKAPLTLFVSASLGVSDGWALWVGQEYGLVVWVGEDKPSRLGTVKELENHMGELAQMLVKMFGLKPCQPSAKAVSVDRNFGMPTAPDVAGSVRIITPVLPEREHAFLLPSVRPERRAIHQLSPEPPLAPLSRRLPAPRPNLTTIDGQDLAVATVTPSYLWVWPRPEGFSSGAEELDYVRSLGVMPEQTLAAAPRYVPRLAQQLIAGESVPWTTYGRAYNHGWLYQSIVGAAGLEEVDTARPVDGLPLYPLWRGRYGLEKWLDTRDLTEDGVATFFPDLFGYLQDAAVKGPTAVPPVVLSLNHAWQETAAHVMRGVERGAFVMLDAETGAVRVAVSAPLGDEFNRCFMGQYPPASAIKPFVAVAALDKMGACPDFDLGPLVLQGITFDNAGESGRVGLSESLTRSHNSYFMQLGLMVGADAMITAYSWPGFGQKPKLQIPTARGNLPGQYSGSEIDDAELANLAIGQGQFLASPLQMARAFAWLGNRGVLPGTTLIEASAGSGMPTLEMNPELWQEVDMALGSVVGSGTGSAAWLAGYPSLRGKTGTGQIGKKGNYSYVAWFCGYVYLDGILHAFAVAVEGRPGQSITGGKNAAPLLRRFLSSIKLDGSTPLPPPAEELEPLDAATPAGAVVPSATDVDTSNESLADQVLRNQW